jgi:hypothetical protein
LFKKIWKDNELEYSTAVTAEFPDGKIPENFKNCPTFSSETLDELLQVHFLNEQGLYALKKMMWVIKKTEFQLTYQPMVPQIAALLLTFMSEGDTYSLLKIMLAESKTLLDESHQYKAQEMRGLRWHLTLNQDDYEKFIQSFYENIGSKSKSFNKIQAHGQKIGFDINKMFQDMFKNLFFTWLPLNLVLRIFVCYMNEGVKIYYRMGYAALRNLKKEILAHKDPNTMKEMIRSKLMNLDDKAGKKLIKQGFSLSLKTIKKEFSKLEVDTTSLLKAKIVYRPHLSRSSSIVKDDAFETLWEWIPNTYKLSDPELVYSSYKDGFSLKSVLQKCADYDKACMIVIIKSDCNTIFGAFVTDMFHSAGVGKNLGNDESFVFVLFPYDKKFPCQQKDGTHLVCTREYFAIGDGNDGPAIHLDEELLKGHTYCSETYKNPQFNGKNNKFESEFQCLGMEIYAIE